MVQKRKPLEFSDPYDESIPGGAGGNRWFPDNKPLPNKKYKRTREDELKEQDNLVKTKGLCPGCGHIGFYMASYGLCPECGYQE
jgi:hypothetical protein